MAVLLSPIFVSILVPIFVDKDRDKDQDKDDSALDLLISSPSPANNVLRVAAGIW